MAKNLRYGDTPGVDGLPPRMRRKFSVWTLVVPLALTACIYVVASIIGSTRWTIRGSGHAQSPPAQSTPVRVVREYTTRTGDTWRRVARRTHVSVARLHSLNPHDSARGRIVPGEHLLLRP
jgi:LysM repeat protein